MQGAFVFLSNRKFIKVKHKKKKLRPLPHEQSGEIFWKKTPSSGKWIWIVGVLLLTLIAFYPSFKCGFTNWDDAGYVTENKLITSVSGENIKKIFSIQNDVMLNYHPLTMLSLALDYNAVKFEPVRYHAVNVFIHLLNTLLVFFFAYLLSRRKFLVAIFVSLFFGVHPMHVESVTWVSERKDVLYTFFFVAALIAYLFYNESKKIKFLLLTLFLFVLSLLSKGMAVVLPVVLLLIDYYQGRKITLKTIAEKIPFFILSLIFGWLALRIQSKEAIASYEVFTLFQRICFGFYGFFTYILKLFLPTHLSALYPYPITNTDGSLPLSFYIPAFFGIILFAFFGVMALVKKEIKMKLIAFGFGFYFVTIALVLQFLSVGQVIMAERYSYVPYIGLLFVIGTLLNDLMEKKISLKNPIIFSVFSVAIFFSYITHERTKVWMNSGTLWTDVIEKYPFPPWPVEVAYENRGNYFAKEQNEFDKGLADYNILVQMKTKNHKIYSNMGNIYGLKGQKFEKAGQKENVAQMYKKSIEAFTSSVVLDSSDSKTFVNRAITYSFMNRLDLAIADFEKALKLAPNDLETIEKRAYAYYMSGKTKEAILDYDKLINVNSSNNNLFLHRGIAKFNAKMYNEAIEDFNTLLKRDPNNGNVYFNLSVCYSRMGDNNNAILNAQKAQQCGYAVAGSYLDDLKKAVKKE